MNANHLGGQASAEVELDGGCVLVGLQEYVCIKAKCDRGNNATRLILLYYYRCMLEDSDQQAANVSRFERPK